MFVTPEQWRSCKRWRPILLFAALITGIPLGYLFVRRRTAPCVYFRSFVWTLARASVADRNYTSRAASLTIIARQLGGYDHTTVLNGICKFTNQRIRRMPRESLFTAARRAVRDFNIDMNKGGLMSVNTEKTMHDLSNWVEALTPQWIKDEAAFEAAEKAKAQAAAAEAQSPPVKE